MTTSKTTGSPAQNAAAEAVETVANVGRETLETAIRLGAEAATEGYRNAADYGTRQADMARSAYDKAVSHGRDNVDAMSEASALAFAGAEACLAEIADGARTAVAENLALMQRAFSVSSPRELLDIQIEAGNRSINRMIAQTTKINRIAADSATKASAPLKARLDAAMESFVKPYAA